MKVFEKCSLILVLLIISSLFFPLAVFAADDDFEMSYTMSTNKLPSKGGMVKVYVLIKNLGATPITAFEIEILTDVNFFSNWVGALAPGSGITRTLDVPFEEHDVGRNLIIRVNIENDGGGGPDGHQQQPIKVEEENNVFRSSGSHVPEKAVYYAGETVTVTDTFRNSLIIEATDVVVKYYFKPPGAGAYYGDPIDIGTVAGGATAENAFDYTFTEDDIGDFRIGSELTYDVAGEGPYNEYNVAHDFVVKAAPTPSPTPEATPTDTPAPTPEDTATPTESLSTDATPPDATEGNGAAQAGEEERETGKTLLTFLENPLGIVIAVLAVLLIAAVIVLAVVIAKKNKGGFS